MRIYRRFLLAGSLLSGLLNAADVAPTPMLTYQGRLVEDSLPVSGERNFTFSIVNATGTVLWTSGSVKLSVRSGLYSTVLGTNGMPVIPTSVLALSDLRLRITVATTTLSPDISLVPALQARAAWEAITVTGPFAGDAGGTQNAFVVKGLLGRPLDGNLIPQAGQALVFDGQAWAPANVAAASNTIADNAVTNAKIADGAVTNAKITANTIASDRIVNVAWGKLTGLPTTIAGYGITDAVTNTGGVPSIQADFAANRPAFGSAGRIFIATDTNTISRDTGSAWVQIGSGSAGHDGKTVLNGTSNPTSEGVNGDFYINTATSTIFGPKTGGAWGSGTSLVGPATGAAGGDLSGNYPNPIVRWTTPGTIGSGTPNTGTFTTLSASGVTTVSNATVSTATNNGALVVTGGMGIGGRLNVGGTITLPAGTATAGTAPLKFTAGTNLTTTEAGAAEWDGSNLFLTQTTGPTRRAVAYTDSSITGFTGILPIAKGGTNASDAATARSNLGLGNVQNIKVNLGAAGAPAVGDDSSAGYVTGSLWVDTTNGQAWICFNPAVGEAVWKRASLTDVVASGTYTKVTVDAQGRVTTGASLAAGDIPWTTPGTIGSGTPNTGAFTTLSTTNNLTTGGRIASGITSTTTSSTNVAAINTLEVTAAITITTLTNGVAGQQIYPFNSSAVNTVIIAHDATLTNGTGTIRCPGGIDVSLPAFGGVTLVCNSSNNWYVVGRPTVYSGLLIRRSRLLEPG